MAFETNFYLAIIIAGILMAITAIALLLIFHAIRKPLDPTMEHLSDGILILDAEDNILDMNRAAERFLGLSRMKTFKKPCGRVLNNLLPQEKLNDGLHHEAITDASGQKICLDISLARVPDRYGVCSRKLLILRDITDYKQTCRKLEEQIDQEKKQRIQLEGELDKRSRYTRAIVHELNSPLTALISSSELLQELKLDQMPASLVSNIRRASTHLELRTAELTELARGEVGMLKIQPKPVDIHQVLDEIVAEMTPVAARKNLALVADIPSSLPSIMGDKDRIRQVMLNLLSNSIKFTFEGAVTIRVRCDSTDLLVQVEDTGRGIEPEEMEFLFDPYRRKQGLVSRNGGGLGIGLSLCKIFIELHHGKIWVDSTAGKGTTISFTLPVTQEKVSEPSDSAPVQNLT